MGLILFGETRKVIPSSVRAAFEKAERVTVESILGSRGDVSGLIHKWAEVEGIDDESLFITLANAYCEKNDEPRVTGYFDSALAGTEVEDGYPEAPAWNSDTRSGEEAELDLERYHQQFGEDGYLFERNGEVYIDHSTMPVEVSKAYWDTVRKSDTYAAL